MASGSPVSAKPEVNMLMPPTPFAIASFTMNGATCLGTAQMTRSTSSGISVSDLKFW